MSNTRTGIRNSESDFEYIPPARQLGPSREAFESEAPAKHSSNRPKRTSRLKRIRIADALRKEGLGEREVARKLADVVTRLTPGHESMETNDKLLLDTLKECFRHLDDPAGPVVLGAPVSVNLVHNVPRPARTRMHADANKKRSQR